MADKTNRPPLGEMLQTIGELLTKRLNEQEDRLTALERGRPPALAIVAPAGPDLTAGERVTARAEPASPDVAWSGGFPGTERFEFGTGAEIEFTVPAFPDGTPGTRYPFTLFASRGEASDDRGYSVLIPAEEPPPPPPSDIVAPTVVSPDQNFRVPRDGTPITVRLHAEPSAEGLEVYSWPEGSGGKGHQPPATVKAGEHDYEFQTASTGPNPPYQLTLICKTKDGANVGERHGWLYAGGDISPPPPPPPDGLEGALRVEGNKIMFGDRKVMFGGVNMLVLLDKVALDRQYKDIEKIAAEGANAIRFAIEPGYYRVQRGAAINYLAKLVQKARSQGLFALISWHTIGEPDGWFETPSWAPSAFRPFYDSSSTLAKEFWADVTPLFKDDGAVMFETWNEAVYKGAAHLPDGHPLKGLGSQKEWLHLAPVQQKLVDTIRGLGGKNLILIGGTLWARNVAAWYEAPIKDPLNNIAIARHDYEWHRPTNNNWTTKAVRGKLPIVVSEFGIPDDHFQANRPEMINFVDNFINQESGGFWWSLSTGSNPHLLKRREPWEYENSGTYFKKWLASLGPLVRSASSAPPSLSDAGLAQVSQQVDEPELRSRPNEELERLLRQNEALEPLSQQDEDEAEA